MVRSEWICNSCGKGFETKGKRDCHRENQHRQNATIKLSSLKLHPVKRSEGGKFVCTCGKRFSRAYTLRRHGTNCNSASIANEIDIESLENEEGTPLISRHKHDGKMLKYMMKVFIFTLILL
jgi:hypothetical protein